MARTTREWLDAYAESHRHPVNKRIHWVCVPLIVLSLTGLLWSLWVPEATAGLSPLLNWATLFLAAAVIYYLFLSWSLAAGMLVFALVLIAATWALSLLPAPLWLISLVVFVIAWVGQFIGHKIEGRKPSFFQDIQFLMIGPLWLLAHLYDRIGLRY